jgi:hypothetical protein
MCSKPQLLLEKMHVSLVCVWADGSWMLWKNVMTGVCSTVKKVTDFSVPSLIKLFPPGRVWFVTSRLGTGKSLTFFTVYTTLIVNLLNLVIPSKRKYKYTSRVFDALMSVSPHQVYMYHGQYRVLDTGQSWHSEDVVIIGLIIAVVDFGTE